ncbi:Fibronectin type III domain [Actinomyces bovis]|uniref:Fibronectin type III domain n=1 Tax=Actinomyces bovis TaxID=1658 RepID=A0ABY1VNB5_9ACTO|nr:Ig-like domain-containing protein [Actinomyces bovis]SPT52962.1 Fibronectin type III domain [Actinomyces bovis]VEG55163.1 Fibronectin type III domain [Actinomyces israelii]
MSFMPLRRIAASVAGTLSAGAVVMALLHPGVVIREIDLHDGGVWVTNQNLRAVGHLNYPAHVIDGGLRAASAKFDVSQEAGTVYVADHESGAFTQVDVAKNVLLSPVQNADNMQLGGDRLGIADPTSGSIWVMPASQQSTFEPTVTEPILRDEKGAVLAMGLEGTAHIVSPETKRITTITPAGSQQDQTTTALPELGANADLQVSAVGKQTVVLDRASGTLIRQDGSTAKLNGTELQLQVPGPDSEEVLVASSEALLRVDRAGKVTPVPKHSPGGKPARPARMRSCVYSAWSGQGGYLRDCTNDADDRNEDRADLNAADTAVFRMNRGVIVLNNTQDGGIWLPDEDMVKVDNWDQINSDLKKDDEKQDDTTRTDQESPAERRDENTPPDAIDDEFGVRPGRSVSLPVISNDTDPDGDVLVAKPITQPELGEVVQVRDGAALQARIKAEATGTSSFVYELSDGGSTDTANVTLTVHPWEVNEGPKQTRISTMILGQGARGTTNVSGDWIDPDGDAVYLESVAFPAGLDVSWRADGTVTVHDLGQGTGIKELTVTYSDGKKTTEGQLRIDVRGAENIAPVANGDHLVVAQGQTAQLDPRANDTDANGDTLRVASISQPTTGISASLDPDLSIVSVTGQTVGTYYLEYKVTDGPAATTGFIRVDVVAADSQGLPVAQDDVTTLPAGGEALVDVLANDSDPAGGVLVAQSVHLPEGSPLVVALLEHHILRITAPGGLTSTQQLTYTVANGAGTSVGQVMVIPAPPVSATEPPVLTDDNLVVRVGDVGSVNVLDNDRSPAGLKLTVDDKLQHTFAAATASPFVSDGVVRVRAGDKPGTGTLVYTVHDAAGNIASAQVTVSVVALDEDTNTAPHPKDVTGWAVAGQTVKIPVPLTGIDSEGDSVTLVGVSSSPKLGTVEVDENSLKYTAGQKSSGTDVFTYTVKDRLGKSATATVRVGVAAAATTNQRPVAVPDQVNVRPGKNVSVPVLGNDVDPDGDPLELVPGLVSSSDPTLVVEPRGKSIVLTTPAAEGTYTVQYGLTDSRSEPVTGLLTVVVSADAPLLAPIARDDIVATADTANSSAVSVNVLDNDSDPDGDVHSDELTTTDEGVSVSGGTLTIPVNETARYVLYTLTDPDGLTASAVVFVPGSKVSGPEINATKAQELQVKAGESVSIPLADYVITREGHSVQLTDAAKVSASLGWDGTPLVKDATTLSFGAAKDYSGPSSVTFEVTDGKDLNDSDGRVASLTLPITVLPAGNQAPTITPTNIEVAAGDAAVTVDVSKWVTDPDGEEPSSMTYSIEPSLNGASASLSGTTLSVNADATTKQGSAGQVNVTVKDAGGATATGTAQVSVVASTKERIQVSPISVTTNAGKTVSVDLAQSASNPFPDTPLHVVGTPTASDAGSVTVEGTKLGITPPAGTNGTTTVAFRLGDKTNDPAREVEGSVQVTVKDKPAAPTAVTASSAAAGTATVTWSAGAANGDPISGFTVFDETQGDSKACGQVTTCLIESRKNGVDHTFHVVATNGVGDSPASASATTNIDVVPGVVTAPTGTPGDNQATFNWTAPENEGSAISGYTVYLSGPDGVKEQTVTTTSATFTGLRNGAAYTATVTATNKKGTSKISGASKAVTPYGRPEAVPQLQAQAASLGTGGSSDRVNVSWTAAGGNGRDIAYYTLSWPGGSKRVESATSTTIESVNTSNSQVVFKITATNDTAAPATHTSAETSTSAWVVGLPPTPSGSGLQATGQGASINLTATAKEGNGWSASDLTVQWSANGSEWKGMNDLTGNGLAIGSAASISVRACGTKTGSTVCSQAATVGSVTPYEPPTSPAVSCAAGAVGQVRCSWSGAKDGGATSELEVDANGSIERIGLQDSGERTFNVGEGGTGKLCVYAVRPGQNVAASELGSGSRCASATAPSYPRKVGTFKGAYMTCSFGACSGRKAWRVGVDLQGWPPNTNVTCSGDWAGHQESTTVPVDGNGNYHGEPNWDGYWKGRLMSMDSSDFVGENWFTCR